MCNLENKFQPKKKNKKKGLKSYKKVIKNHSYNTAITITTSDL